MTISLVKGGGINLSKEHPDVQKFVAGLGWSPSETPGVEFDLDASAFLCKYNAQGTPILLDDPGFVFYNNPKSPCGGVMSTGDDRTGGASDGGDDEQIIVDFSKLDPRVDEIALIVTIYGAHSRKQHFGLVKDAYIRILDAGTNQELARYDLGTTFAGDGGSTFTAVHFGSIYKDPNGHWQFKAIGVGYDAELDFFVKGYGGHLQAA